MIDDSPSMTDHWDDVVDTVQALAYLTKRVDPDGIDLYFVSAPSERHHKQDSTGLVRIVREHSPSQGCFIEACLNTLTSDRIIPQTRFGGRKLSIYILTDGEWSDNENNLFCGVDKPIRRIVSELKRQHLAPNTVALQFVRFGDSHVAKRRLRALDNMAKPDPHDPTFQPLDMYVILLLYAATY